MQNAGNGHNTQCERAKGHQCRCTTCGGSLHGFTKWLEFVDPPADDTARRDAERRAVDDQLKKAWKTEQSRRGGRQERAGTAP